MGVLLFIAVLAQDCSQAEVLKLIGELGSDKVDIREIATARLKEVTHPGDPSLMKAARSSDSEIAIRARGILHSVLFRRCEPMRDIAYILEHSWSAFLYGDFDRSIQFSDALLDVDPDFAAAQELRDLAQSMRREEGNMRGAVDRVRRWQAEQELLLCKVRLPPSAKWPNVSVSLAQVLWRERHPKSCECGIVRKLDRMKIDLAFENTKFEDILAFIRDFSGLNIVLDAEVSGPLKPDERVTFKVKDLALKNVLKLLLAPHGLTYIVTEEDVVLITERWRR